MQGIYELNAQTFNGRACVKNMCYENLRYCKIVCYKGPINGFMNIILS